MVQVLNGLQKISLPQPLKPLLVAHLRSLTTPSALGVRVTSMQDIHRTLESSESAGSRIRPMTPTPAQDVHEIHLVLVVTVSTLMLLGNADTPKCP